MFLFLFLFLLLLVCLFGLLAVRSPPHRASLLSSPILPLQPLSTSCVYGKWIVRPDVTKDDFVSYSCDLPAESRGPYPYRGCGKFPRENCRQGND